MRKIVLVLLMLFAGSLYCQVKESYPHGQDRVTRFADSALANGRYQFSIIPDSSMRVVGDLNIVGRLAVNAVLVPLNKSDLGIDTTNYLQKANNLADLQSVATARLNIRADKRTAIEDANYTILSTDKTITIKGISTTRTFTLPAANSVNAGYEIIIIDESGLVSSSNKLIMIRAGSDSINTTTADTMTTGGSFRRYVSNGIGKWSSDVGIVRVNATQTLTNKSMSATSNTFTNIGKSYLIFGNNQIASPADSTIYYVGGSWNLTINTSESTRRTYLPTACTVTAIGVSIQVAGTLGSTEYGAVYLRVNNTTDYLVTSTAQFNASLNITSLTGQSIPLTAGGYFNLKIITPNWATNPTTMYVSVTLEVINNN